MAIRQAPSRPSSSAASGGSWFRVRATSTTSAASATIISAIVRWKRPASECGQGSSGRTISRPWSESVQRSLRGQRLHTWARAR